MKPELSVIVPIYNEESVIDLFCSELRAELDKLEIQYQVIFINDGSTDKTQSIIEHINWPQLEIYELLSNQGQMRAILEGLIKSKGQLLITLDADLEHPLNYIKDFINKQKETQADVVYGCRIDRSDRFFKRTSAQVYYFLMNKISGFNIRSNAADFRLITESTKNQLLAIGNQDIIFRIVIPSLKLREAEILYVAQKRKLGTSKYTLKKMFCLGVKSIVFIIKNYKSK